MYALTGHTNGIGAELYARLSPNCLGLSRATGHDITTRQGRDLILYDADQCDVFINNAHSGFGQTQLLIELFQLWRDKPKQIVNVGSAIVDRRLRSDKLHLLTYAAEKRALHSIISDMQGYACRVSYVQFGYVGTPEILAKYPGIDEYLSVASAADLILGAVAEI